MNDADNTQKTVFVVSDRVRRSLEGAVETIGTVEEVREETNTSATDRPKKRKYIIKVKWDSGTVSYFDPQALKLVV